MIVYVRQTIDLENEHVWLDERFGNDYFIHYKRLGCERQTGWMSVEKIAEAIWGKPVPSYSAGL